MRRTPWFSMPVKPARVGVYERAGLGGGDVLFQNWNGKFWGFWCHTPRHAAKPANANCQSLWQRDMWRGIRK